MAYKPKEIETKFNEVCKLIAEEGLSLRKAVIEIKISRAVFYKWVDESDEKKDQYARATEDRQDLIFNDIFTIADDQENDVYVDEKGFEQTNHNVIQRARLRVDARKWALSKMNPKKYGDRTSLDVKTTYEQPLFPDVPKNDSNK